MNHYLFKHNHPLTLESGQVLPEFELEYATLGKLNDAQDNVIWICHALTANADAAEWWPGLVGEGKFFDPTKHFIICANVLGSCYGSTGPLSTNPETGEPYYHSFPQITIRDMVAALDLLRTDLGIQKIHTLIGGSLGGQQAMEWAIIRPNIIQNLVLLATNANHSPWGIAFNESQRLAIQADPTWQLNLPDAGQAGLKAARSIALLSYRNYQTYEQSQSETDSDKTDHYKASSYQNYQGTKLVNRFNAFSYWVLSKAMDSHHVGRKRESIQAALASITAATLVVGIKSDILFPITEQQLLANLIPNATFVEIDSDYGHDGFLIEYSKLTACITNFSGQNSTLVKV